jgi:peptide/nickel transport system substrate-binding protein
MKRSSITAILAVVVIVLVASGVYFFAFQPKPPSPMAEHPTLTIAPSAGISTLDPQNWLTQTELGIDEQIYDSLWNFNLTMIPTPALVSSSDVSQDKLTWTLHLRQNVMFGDGTPFNASAVAFNLQRISNATASFEIEPVASWDVIDQYTIAIHLKTPYAALPFNLASATCAMLSPSAVMKYGEDYGRHPVGTGPFVMTAWVENQYINLTANPNYWGGAPILGNIVWKIIPDDTARYLALKAGEIDIDQNPPISVIPEIEGSSNLQMIKELSTRMVGVWFNPNISPVSDIKVREAIMHAINKTELVDDVIQGYAAQANNFMGTGVYDRIPDDQWGAPDGAYPYNPTLAKQLLAQAGYTQGADGIWRNATSTLTIVLNTPSGRYLKDKEIAEAIVGDLTTIGIDAKVQILDPPTLFKEVSSTHSVPFYLLGWSYDPYPAGDLGLLFHSSDGGLPAWSSISSPQIDSLLDQASSATDLATIQNLYIQAQHAIMDTAGVYPIYYTYNLFATSKNVKNFRVLANEDPYKMINVTVEPNSMSTLIAPVVGLTVTRLPKLATLTRQLY